MRKPILLLYVLASAATTLQAQSLDECIQLARQNSLSAKAANLQVERAQRNEGTYFEMEKTELTLSQDPTSGGSPDNALTISQSIDFPTVYATRHKMLKAETEVERARTALVLCELQREVSNAYTDLLLKHHEAELLQQNDSLLTEFVQMAEIRYKNGETNRLEVLNARKMCTENSLRLKAIRNEELAAGKVLSCLLNQEQAVTPTDDYLPRFLSETATQTDGFSYTATLIGALSDGERERAERELKQVRSGYAPSFTFGLRRQMVFTGWNPYGVDRAKFKDGDFMGFEVGMSFPLFFGSQRAKTAVARYDLDIAVTKMQEEEQKANTEYLVARNALQNATDNYQQWTGQILSDARELRQLSLAEYRAGEISYVEHIQNLTSALETELQSAQVIDALNKALIQMKYLLGK